MKKFIITTIIITLSFSANAQSWWNNKRIKGNGNVTTETRNTSNYNGVISSGSFDIKLIPGKEGNITLKGESNLMEYIITEVKEGKLRIKVKKNTNLKFTKNFTITVPYNEINLVGLSGSGDITNSGTINADDFKISLSGSGDIDLNTEATKIKTSIAGSGNIKLNGNSNTLTCSVAGSGSIKAFDLKTNSIAVSLSGSGNVKTTVSEKIKVRIAGSGSVYYKGNPKKIDSKSAGSGSVIDRN